MTFLNGASMCKYVCLTNYINMTTTCIIAYKPRQPERHGFKTKDVTGLRRGRTLMGGNSFVQVIPTDKKRDLRCVKNMKFQRK